MSERKAETISIGGGVAYAKVSARSAEFHRDNEQCSVETSCEFKEGYVLFHAKVTTKKGTFTGHSMDKLSGRQKQFEKQETIAVGRALAFAGYLASGDIACAEEMADVVTAAQVNSVKLKFAKLHEDELKGLDRAQKQQKFSEWCLSVTGEEADYNDYGMWTAECLRACWRKLIGPDADVPFEE
jgi:hypothetical protein